MVFLQTGTSSVEKGRLPPVDGPSPESTLDSREGHRPHYRPVTWSRGSFLGELWTDPCSCSQRKRRRSLGRYVGCSRPFPLFPAEGPSILWSDPLFHTTYRRLLRRDGHKLPRFQNPLGKHTTITTTRYRGLTMSTVVDPLTPSSYLLFGVAV